MNMVSIWKESLKVNMLEILTHVSAYMVVFYIYVEHLLHGYLKLERVLPYHPEAEYYTTSDIPKQRTFWRKLESKFSFQATSNVTMLVPSNYQIITATVNVPSILTLANILYANGLKTASSRLSSHLHWTTL
jgi:hypothetical protein